jgi:glyoxylase-like metal-dependent hydrolase (beta-lactamase superfamily II)
MKNNRLLGTMIGMLFLVLITPLGHTQDFSKVQIKVVEVKPGIHMLMGEGGNILVSSGTDGVFMIDDQFAPLTEKIKTAIASFTSGSIRFVINTHWHYDHTGGNENMGEAGAVIIAHENVRRRLSTDQVLTIFNRTIPPLSKEGLPAITFTRDVTFHLNGQRIDVFHIKRAHTDGDAVAYFTDANVIHTGDILFEGMYPFIDVEHGGSISGMIDATNRILAMIDDKTGVIPGHGMLTDKRGLIVDRDMLTEIRDRILSQIQAGKTLEEIKLSRPTQAYDSEWGGGFLNPDVFVGIVYQSLIQEK